MDHHSRYLAEEVVYDCAEGLLSRREALRQLGLLGFTAMAATTLLAACGDSGGDGAASTSGSTAAATSSVPAAPTADATEAITWGGPAGQLRGAFAAAPGPGPKGAVLVIHENRGLTDHIRSVASRLAGDGYSALAVDLLSEEGGTAALGDPANATAALNAAPPSRFVADMRSGLDELARRASGEKLGIVGFCFGGMMVWNLLAAGEPRLAAAVPFYGPATDTDFSRSRAAVLGVYAELDARVDATREAAAAGLQKAGLVHEIRTFPGVDHAFFNDTGPRYQPEQAAAAYRALLEWFGRHLA